MWNSSDRGTFDWGPSRKIFGQSPANVTNITRTSIPTLQKGESSHADLKYKITVVKEGETLL